MVSGPRWHRPRGVANRPDQEHSPRHVLRFVSCEGLRVGHTGHRVGKRCAYPARTPLRPTAYPTPVWGTAGVPGYDAGPFVRSGYKWTARTTELHPDGECKASTPPRGNSRGGDPSQRQAAPPPPDLPTPHTHQSPGSPEASTKGATPKATEQKGGGGSTIGGEGVQRCRAMCRASCNHRHAGRATPSPPVRPCP